VTVQLKVLSSKPPDKRSLQPPFPALGDMGRTSVGDPESQSWAPGPPPPSAPVRPAKPPLDALPAPSKLRGSRCTPPGTNLGPRGSGPICHWDPGCRQKKNMGKHKAHHRTPGGRRRPWSPAHVPGAGLDALTTLTTVTPAPNKRDF
jgi:hypothetical protein